MGPRVDASNQTVHIGRLNKAGRKISFEMLLQSVNHLVDGNPHLLAYTKRTVGKSRNKIRATVVARTIRQIFYILKNREQNRFIDIHNFTVITATIGKNPAIAEKRLTGSLIEVLSPKKHSHLSSSHHP